MDAEELTKNLIKNINDEDMVGAKANFEKLIANKVYDRLEDKKEGLGKTMFNKDGQQNNQDQEDEEENKQQTSSDDHNTDATSHSEEPATEPVAVEAE
ncbi:MAG: hypothetical protein VW270_00395 [Candidatus Poseidoniales archaeon]